MSDNPNDTCSIVSLGSIAQEPKLKSFIAQQTDYPFIQWQYLYALEHSGSVGAETGWLPRHLCLMQEGRLLGFLPLYEKNNSAGEYVFDHAWANAYAEHGLRYYPKLVSAIPFSPIQGPRLILADSVDPQWAWRQLFQWLKQFCLQQDSSSWHCLFMSPEQIEQLPSDQIIERKDCHFFWHNRNYRDFEEFLAALSSKKRKNIRRERRSVAESGVIYRIFTGQEIDSALMQQFYIFYCRTYLLHGQRPHLTEEFFQRLLEGMSEQLVLIMGQREQQFVGGALFFVDSNQLYGRYWGCSEEISCFHFETCYYRGIQYCIERGVKKFDPGVQGEHKLLRGFVPQETRSAHWIKNPAFRDAISQFVIRERQMVSEYRQQAEAYLPYKKAEYSNDIK